MLSGGERARLLLAKLSMENNNFLILDEPTNHLDIDSKEVLENALIDFDGALLFVSHDRYFINRVATQVLELSEEGSTLYLGDYEMCIRDSYWEMKESGVIEKTAMVFGQMNEPPGARMRVALTGLTIAEYFRDVEGQDVLLFIDNIFRFTQAGSEVSALLGRMPSALSLIHI